MGLFRAVLRRGEVSPRALRLTAAAIEANPAFYTAWSVLARLRASLRRDGVAKHVTLFESLTWWFARCLFGVGRRREHRWYRRKCLDATGADLRAELARAADLAGSNPKNYQFWFVPRNG